MSTEMDSSQKGGHELFILPPGGKIWKGEERGDKQGQGRGKTLRK